MQVLSSIQLLNSSDRIAQSTDLFEFWATQLHRLFPKVTFVFFTAVALNLRSYLRVCYIQRWYFRCDSQLISTSVLTQLILPSEFQSIFLCFWQGIPDRSLYPLHLRIVQQLCRYAFCRILSWVFWFRLLRVVISFTMHCFDC